MNSATQSLRPHIERVRRAWRGSALPGFFAWWGGELRMLLPTRWQAAFSGGEVWCLLQHEAGQWVLRRDGNGLVLARWSESLEPAAQLAELNAAVANIDRQDLRLALCIPTDNVLRRSLFLPAATRDNLRQVGSFEMDRQTPFRVEQVYYDLRELSGPTPPGKIAAELVVIIRSALDAQLEGLREAGIAIDAVDLFEGSRRLGLNLLPREQANVHRDPRRRLNLALIAGVVVLLLLCLGQWLRNRQETLDAMQAQVDSMHAEAKQIGALRQQLQDSVGAAGFLARRKADSIAVIDLLQDLTGRLPDDTWLERFTVDNSGRIGIQGQSAKAAHLIDALQGSTVISNANFQGVIQRDPTTGKERFYMDAQLHTAAHAKPAGNSSAGGTP